jgi:hypothetical protein
MSRSPPLRFLAVVLGGWAALRAAFIAPPWSTPPAGAAPPPGRARTPPGREWEVGRAAPEPVAAPARRAFVTATSLTPLRAHPAAALLVHAPPPGEGAPRPQSATAAASPFPAPHPVLPPRPDPGSAEPRRWSLSAWSFVRRGSAAPLAAAGLLGGSQAGARLTYRLNRDSARPLALSVRVSTPLRSGAGAEAALGLDWRPVARLPIHLLAERRQALGRDGRSAFGLTAFGGVSDAPLGRLRIDAYAQAGLVGARSRDLFGDGSIRLSLPLGERLRVGAGAWAAAQPGLARLDLGPQAALRLPVAGRSVTVAADWRLRVAGNADPGSGPALTVATDF